MQKPGFHNTLQTLLIIFLVIAGLIIAKPFLVPVCFAGLFAMLFLPLCRRFERMGIKRGLSAFLCVFILLTLILGVIALIAWQVTNLTSDLGSIEDKIRMIFKEIEKFITEVFGISRREQQEIMEKQSEGAAGLITKISESFLGTIVHFILVLVYMLLFLFYRRHIKKFIRLLIPKKEDANTDDAISNIEKVSQQYLTGLGLMIVCLWIMYSIGFTIVGLKNAYFFAILCGLFEIVPFIGNLIGNLLAVLMAITQGGGTSMVIGIIITYALVQFIQTYFLEPLVVGTEVNINPLFTIMGLVAGELIWGIPGMVLAIPLLGIVKIICDHVPALQPYGFLIGKEKKKSTTVVDKIKKLFKK